MKPIQPIQEIKEKLLAQAVTMLAEAGYVVTEDGVRLELTVAGYHKKHDGWSCSIGNTDWNKIFSLTWGESENALLESLKAGQNQPISIPRPHKREVNSVEVINAAFKAENLPYLLAQVVPPQFNSAHPTYRIFIRP